MKFKLSRKRKKQYKKDYFGLVYSKLWKTKEVWEFFYFHRRIEVRSMEILTYPDYNIETGKYEFDPKFYVPASNEQLLDWYKKYYPNDKLAHHYCKQNRHKWDIFNSDLNEIFK